MRSIVLGLIVTTSMLAADVLVGGNPPLTVDVVQNATGVLEWLVGGSLPARLWHDVMTVAHEGLPARALAAPIATERAGLGARPPLQAVEAAPSLRQRPEADALAHAPGQSAGLAHIAVR